ncbi:MAG: histidine kinase [Bacillota bacterium]|nr:histidine kinase [Bacillota bacterium]MDI7250128.1 histidine kinase [Bacillota bacterium]
MDANGEPRARTDRLQAEIERLEAEIEELKGRLPRHSVRPAMLTELEDLEEKLEKAREAARNAESHGSR